MYASLKGRTVAITGASRGIGRAIAQAFAAAGCDLVLAARDEGLLGQVAGQIEQEHRVGVRTCALDLSAIDNVLAFAEACRDADILVNNAGAIPFGTLEEVDGAAWRRAWDLKVFGYIDLTRAVLPAMYASGQGVIVNIIGAAALRPNPRYIAGCVGNAALDMFTRCIGAESIKRGVRIVAVHPGPIVSERVKAEMRQRAEKELGSAERWQELMASLSPTGKAGVPEDVAAAVLFLASDQAGFVSGAALKVDAGRL
ncbi:MAG: short-chain dehydrogenase/reductase [Alphaproteobacteria bacterium]